MCVCARAHSRVYVGVVPDSSLYLCTSPSPCTSISYVRCVRVRARVCLPAPPLHPMYSRPSLQRPESL